MMHKSFESLYKDELNNLRVEAKAFSQKQPALAPMLGQSSTDPDTERLLEGVAYLNAVIRKKLEDDFPEVLYELINVLFPHYLRPIPSMSIVQFTPNKNAMQSIDIKKGASLKAEPYNGVVCEFQTAWEMRLQPFTVTESTYEKTGENSSELNITFGLDGVDMTSLDLSSLDFFINDNLANATALSSLLGDHVSEIVVLQNNKPTATLDKQSLTQLGMKNECSIFPDYGSSMSSYRLLQEYFILPQKFMLFRLEGLEKLKERIRSDKFTIKFKFTKAFNDFSAISKSAVTLHSVPVINLFDDEAEPVRLSAVHDKIRVISSNRNKEENSVYDISKIVGIKQGQVEDVEYIKFDKFSKHSTYDNTYQVLREKSFSDSSTEECYIELFHTKEFELDETLVIGITATNGKTPEHLGLGDIRVKTDQTPERVEFANITVPTLMVESPIENKNLWFLISHMTTNVLSIDNVNILKELLTHYIAEHSRDRNQVEANKKRVNAIGKFEIVASTFIKKGMLLRGSKILISISKNGFSSLGDMHLFLSVLHQFFALYTSMNNYMELEAYETISGETFIWAPKMGTQKII